MRVWRVGHPIRIRASRYASNNAKRRHVDGDYFVDPRGGRIDTSQFGNRQHTVDRTDVGDTPDHARLLSIEDNDLAITQMGDE